jgi:hypothetical protein
MMIKQSLLACGLGFLIATAADAISQVAESGQVKPGTAIILLLSLMAVSIARQIWRPR